MISTPDFDDNETYTVLKGDNSQMWVVLYKVASGNQNNLRVFDRGGKFSTHSKQNRVLVETKADLVKNTTPPKEDVKRICCKG